MIIGYAFIRIQSGMNRKYCNSQTWRLKGCIKEILNYLPSGIISTNCIIMNEISLVNCSQRELQIKKALLKYKFIAFNCADETRESRKKDSYGIFLFIYLISKRKGVLHN